MRNSFESKKGVSVVVCCYNSAERLPKTLEYLAGQKTPDPLKWEVVIVDNASTDNTATVAKKIWFQYGNPVPLRIVDEPHPGLSAARKRGMAASHFELIIFADDDNWLCRDYVARVFAIFDREGSIGVVGGHGEPVFESQPPDWFDQYAHYFAVGKQNETSGEVSSAVACVYGAGMAIRKSAWRKVTSAGFESILSDRKGSSLASGGDHELCLVLKIAGYKVWHESELKFKHFITRQRLNWEYLLNLTECIHFSSVYLKPYYEFLGDDSGKQLERRTSWIANAGKAARKLAKYCRMYIECRIKYEDTTEVRRQMKKHVGELKGWWAIRKKYGNLCETVCKLNLRLKTPEEEN